MRRTTTVVIGAGHAGLAMSRCLTERSIDHVVLERGEVANSWRTERWDSLRLLTPNWQSRLPGLAYEGDDPDGFRTMPEVIGFIERYARAISAPVQTDDHGDLGAPQTEAATWSTTDRGDWHGADGGARDRRLQHPLRPDARRGRARRRSRRSRRTQLPQPGAAPSRRRAGGRRLGHRRPARRRDPALGPPGDARRAASTSAPPGPTGAGTSSGGWTAPGVLDQRYDEVDDIAPRAPAALAPARRLARAAHARSQRAERHRRRARRPARRRRATAGCSSPARCATIVRWPTSSWAGCSTPRSLGSRPAPATAAVAPPQRFAPDRGRRTAAAQPRSRAAARSQRSSGRPAIRPDYPWLDVPVLDRKGQIRHDGGVVASPGMYVMGLPFLRRRKSTLIDGAADDARDLADHLVHHLAGDRAPAPRQRLASGGLSRISPRRARPRSAGSPDGPRECPRRRAGGTRRRPRAPRARAARRPRSARRSRPWPAPPTARGSTQTSTRPPGEDR